LAVAVFFVVFKLASVGYTITSKLLCPIAFLLLVFNLSPIEVTMRVFNFTDTINFTPTEFST